MCSIEATCPSRTTVNKAPPYKPGHYIDLLAVVCGQCYTIGVGEAADMAEIGHGKMEVVLHALLMPNSAS